MSALLRSVGKATFSISRIEVMHPYFTPSFLVTSVALIRSDSNISSVWGIGSENELILVVFKTMKFISRAKEIASDKISGYSTNYR